MEHITYYQMGNVAWISKNDYGTLYPYNEEICWNEEGCVLNDKGPITAMNYLEEATKNWTNTNEMRISEFTNDSGDKLSMSKTYKTKARMPYYNEFYGMVTNELWLMDHLGNGCSSIEGKTVVNGIDGYWFLSSFATYPTEAYATDICTFCSIVAANPSYGVRPVINLKI